MKINAANLKTDAQAKKALIDHRADRAANLTRRKELNIAIGEAQAEMRLLEKELKDNEADENLILRRIGQIAVGE